MSNTPLLPVIAGALLCAALPLRAQPAPPDFPEGPGKSTVVALCGGCHDINRLRAGYTPAGWRTVMRMMLNFDVPVRQGPDRHGDGLSDQELPGTAAAGRRHCRGAGPGLDQALAGADAGLAAARPARHPRRRDLVHRAVRRQARAARSEDRRDQGISAQDAAHRPARTRRGQGRQYLVHRQSPAASSASSIPGPARSPNTGCRIPSRKDPHTIAIDPAGTVWFTAQNANMVGRIDPKSGEVKLVTSPTPNSRPYGLAINSKGIPVFVEFGSNKIATIDPATLAIKEYPLPNAASRPRRLALTPDDAVWYADFSRGYLGRLDLASGAHAGMALAERAALAALRHRLRQGRALVQRVRPPSRIPSCASTRRRRRSSPWAIPGGGDIVRNMSVTRDGNPVTANSLVNEVGLVEVK